MNVGSNAPVSFIGGDTFAYGRMKGSVLSAAKQWFLLCSGKVDKI